MESRADVADFKVNDDFGMTYQGYSNIATDLEGNFVVCWYDKRNGDNDVYMQLFDHIGTRQGSNRRVNDDAAGFEQLRPSLMKDQTGKFVIAWQDYRVTGYPFNGDIFGQRYNADGSAASVNAKINDDFGVETQGWQDIDADDFGNYVVVWEDNRSGNYDIYAQRYHKSGTKLGANFKVNDDAAAAYQHNPKVAVDGDGDFVVVWYDNRMGNDLVMGQRFNASGVAQAGNFLISDNISGNKCVFPDVACDQNGNFTAVWIDYRNGTYPNNPDVYGRMYFANGHSRTGNFRINSDGTSASQAEVVIGMDYFGNFITAWRDNRSGNNDIYAQYYKPDGVTLGGNYRVNTDATTSTQSFPNVTMDGINIYYTWTDDRNGSFDIYARITEYGSPAIVVSPTSFQFNAQLGGANPANQTLQINNLGYGILNWTATDNQTWLTVTPASGTAPSTPAVSVNIAGLPYGEHNARITVADAAGRDSSRTVVVTLTITAPTLRITPATISVETQLGQAPPDDKFVMIENSGSGSINWSIAGKPNWLGLSQLSGTAPSAVDLIFLSDSLPGTGDYVANLTVTSAQAVNSPQQITVNLHHSVDVPMIAVDPDTLHFAFAQNANSIPTQELVIYNAGVGTLDWLITSDAEWVTTSIEDGLGDAVTNIGILPASLPAGEHYTNLTISDPNAYNSPKHVVIHCSVGDAAPRICSDPAALTVYLREGIYVSDSANLAISNCGGGTMNWTAVSSQPWLSIAPANGSGDVISKASISAPLWASGSYSGSISLTSAQADNSPLSIPVNLSVLPLDTAALSSTNGLPESNINFELGLRNFLPVDSMAFSLTVDDAVLQIDSIKAVGRAQGRLNFTVVSSQSLATMEYQISSFNKTQMIPSGNGNIASIYARIKEGAIADEYFFNCATTVRDSLQHLLHLAPTSGSVAVGAATPIFPVDSPILPGDFTLGPNYPNPFNASTSIPYSIPRSSLVNLEVLNIIGQQVKTLASEYQNNGNYIAVWNGDDNYGRPVTTGIYFVRLNTADISLVTKVVLLK